MTKHLARLAVTAAFALTASAAHAATASANLSVTASVNNNCTISTAPVAFGAYDPVVANASADLDGAGSVTVACTKGTAYWITLDVGQNPQGVAPAQTRRMSSGTDFITYELYTTAGRTVVWDAANFPATGPAASKAAVTIPVFGRITANQDVSAGAYSDTVSATVNY